MPAENQNVDLPAGDTRLILIPLQDKTGAALPDASVVSLTWTLGPKAGSRDGAVLLTQSLGAGISLVDSLATISLESADTIDVPPGSYNHQLRCVLVGDLRETLTRGTFRITPTM